MNMKRIPWWEPRVGEAESQGVADVLASNFLNDGPVTTEFENIIAERLGCKHVIAVTSATTALYLSLVALHIGPGDEVIVPDATFIATANAVVMAGATPVLVDIDPATFTMNPQAFAAAITPQTKAVIPVHISGRAADLKTIMALAEKHGITVIEDAAEAFMSKSDGRYLGTIGKMGCFSFSPMKIITTGQGGVVVTDDDDLNARLRQLKDQGRPVRGTGGDDPHPVVGFNFKLTNLQAAVGVAQLKDLDARLERMRRTCRLYQEGLAGLNGITLPPFDLDAGELPLWIDAIVEDRDALDDFLRARNVDCRRFWHPIHTQPCHRADDDRFPNANKVLGKALWLPSALSLSDEDVATVCGYIREFLAGE
jgi:perosamine synthetase